MIPLEVQLLIAILLDTLIGDPQWWPHPVRLIGALAVFLENHARKSIDNETIAGLLTAFMTVAVTGAVTLTLVIVGYLLNPLLGAAVSIFIMYTGMAARDLAKHAGSVQDALESGDLSLARERVAMICGRDTNTLDTRGVVRATVESVAENTVDGVTAPLLYGVIGGPVGVMVYKAISTLDSTFGYRNERYGRFGWASAKLDDIAAFLPSRITSLLVPCAAWILGMNSRGAQIPGIVKPLSPAL
ncbi:MAG: adenosylcobinamide-phosphate synthase CbiB [Deltaproteobacteria bacterium]|nr:adenosylcobinamide-phosphate synthase CbiB [Deltaproteobacteria bacterium]